MMKMNKHGFTLAELLIALAILGVIATFAIPKILNGQQNQRYNAMAKEAIAAVTQASYHYRYQGLQTAGTRPPDMTHLLNYVSVDTVSLMDSYQTTSTITCSSLEPCLKMHNGSVIFARWMTFNGTSSTNAISFFFDPDGKVTDGTTDGPGKSVLFFLYYDGKLRTHANIEPNTTDSLGVYAPSSTYDPPWFSWDN